MTIATEDPRTRQRCCCHAEHFTETEIEVLRAVADGLTNLEIAAGQNVSGHTVDRHVTQMLRRSGARNRAALVSIAFRTGVLVVDEHQVRPSGRRCIVGPELGLGPLPALCHSRIYPQNLGDPGMPRPRPPGQNH
jgi:DNA-binding CsgD family transcriptional regulator